MKLLALALLCLSGCSSVRQVTWRRLDGAPCETTKVNPAWWSSETVTFCFHNGNAEVVPTNHDDAGMLGGIGGLVGALVGARL